MLKRRPLLAFALLALTFVGSSLAANFLLTQTTETNSTVSFSYPQQAGADGYRYYAPGRVEGDKCVGTRLSRTFDPSRTTVKFGKVNDGTYCVEAVVITPVGAGQYPTAPPPPPPPPPSSEWTFCANEAGTCTFVGTKEVRYGAQGTYTTGVFTNTVACNNVTFGDPIVGSAKTCEYRDYTPPPPPPPGSNTMGWEVTPQNIGLAPFGLSCGSLAKYTGPLPIPAGTTITEKRVEWTSGELNLNAGGIHIVRSCLQPQAGASTTYAVVTSFTPSQPNTIVDSELDGSKVGVQAMSKACGLRGIWGEITRTYVHNVGSGICQVDFNSSLSYDMIVKNSWIGHLVAYGNPSGDGSHNEAATTRCARIDQNPNRKTIWDGNWIQTDTVGNSSGGLFIQTTYGCPVGNVYIRNNLLDGDGNWDLYSDGSSYSGVFELTNNRFVTGGYGPCSISGFRFTTQSGNAAYAPSSPPDYKGAGVSC